MKREDTCNDRGRRQRCISNNGPLDWRDDIANRRGEKTVATTLSTRGTVTFPTENGSPWDRTESGSLQKDEQGIAAIDITAIGDRCQPHHHHHRF